jgi:hypothetical protein
MSPLHKALPPEQKWERTLHTDGLTCSLIVEPGELIIDSKPQSFGVPFGPTARLILLFLQTQARTRGRTPGRRMPLIRLDESALQILDNLALNTARQRSSSNHKRSLKPRDCHVAIGYWATRRNTWRHPQVASTAALQKRRSIKDLPLPGVLPLVPHISLCCCCEQVLLSWA